MLWLNNQFFFNSVNLLPIIELSYFFNWNITAGWYYICIARDLNVFATIIKIGFYYVRINTTMNDYFVQSYFKRYSN